jgi:hypothetical protein
LNSTSEVPYYFNKTNSEYVAWCWKAGNETTVNNDGTHQTTVSVNKDAGFSIAIYTASTSGTAVQETVGHGLGVTPEFVILKDLTNTTNWRVYHKGLCAAGATATANTLLLDVNDAQSGGYGGRVSDVSATTITLGDGTNDGGGVMGNGRRHIVYAWHSVEGYSKFGSYIGNGNADGVFVYTGFRPAFIMGKNITSAREWWMHDTKRDGGINGATQKILYPHLPDVEDTGLRLDMLSNGFKIRLSSVHWNETGDTFIYMAFAEMPFKYANAR